jgi:hypothetical protein
MGSVVVYTALFGAHDELKQQPAITGVNYVCFTDQKSAARGWEVIPVQSSSPDRLAAKDPKMQPHRWVRHWRRSIWIDASVQILTSKFITTALDAMNDGLAFFAHPDRDCIYDEAELSKTIAKYDPSQIDAQIQRYRAEGFPEHAGLWACGIIAREHKRPVKRLGGRWLDRCRTESVQDQISLPPLLRSMRINPGTIPGNLWDNELIRVVDHARDA